MRTKLIAGNWKLRGGLLENQVLINRLKCALCDLQGVDVAICVPYVYLFQAQTLLKGSNIGWGAQNISQYSEGAYTSCISAKMVAEFDACYSIIGHSERRDLKMECNQVATRRLLNALYAGITPIFCIGETLDERESGAAELIVRNQLLNVVYGLDDEAFALAKKLNMVIAYEPVWAVGTGKYASPHQAQRMHAYIRYMIAERDPEFAKSIRIIYGGSISSGNAAGLFAEPDIDGAVVGRSAWVADDFVQICSIAQHAGIYRKHQAS